MAMDLEIGTFHFPKKADETSPGGGSTGSGNGVREHSGPNAFRGSLSQQQFRPAQPRPSAAPPKSRMDRFSPHKRSAAAPLNLMDELHKHRTNVEDVRCTKCNQRGHLEFSCPNKTNPKSVVCAKCGKRGHGYGDWFVFIGSDY
jgi:hypothetical protein